MYYLKQMCTIVRCIINTYCRNLLRINFNNMTIQQKVGITIKELRKEQGMSQETFAYESGIDRRYMSDIENGKRNISLDILERIADKLEISLSKLFQKAEEFK